MYDVGSPVLVMYQISYSRWNQRDQLQAMLRICGRIKNTNEAKSKTGLRLRWEQ